jgi:hypothetical protein
MEQSEAATLTATEVSGTRLAPGALHRSTIEQPESSAARLLCYTPAFPPGLRPDARSCRSHLGHAYSAIFTPRRRHEMN